MLVLWGDGSPWPQLVDLNAPGRAVTNIVGPRAGSVVMDWWRTSPAPGGGTRVLVGAYNQPGRSGESNAGRMWVCDPDPAVAVIDLAVDPAPGCGLSVRGPWTDAKCCVGYLGDLNVDGHPDLVVGSSRAAAPSPWTSPGRGVETGFMQVVLGPLPASGIIDLVDDPAGWRAVGQVQWSLLVPAGVVDLDGDGRPEVLASSVRDRVDGQSNVGAVYVFSAPADLAFTHVDLAKPWPGWVRRLEPAGAYVTNLYGFGAGLVTADPDGDGRADLVVRRFDSSGGPTGGIWWFAADG